MDIFDVLKAIYKKKIEWMREGIRENKALIMAEYDVCMEYHLKLDDIQKLCKH